MTQYFLQKIILFPAQSKRLYKLVIPAFALLATISGCANFNGTRFEGLLGTQENVIHLAYAIAEKLDNHAYPPLIARHPEKPILTTTFVNNDNLNETSHFSRVLQENISTKFVQMGYTVREARLGNELNIEEQSGEMMLSRNLNNLRPSQPAQAISVGTYALTGRVMYITAKLVKPENGNIISSVDYKIQMDENMLAMFGLQLLHENEIDMIDEPKPSLVTRLLY